MRAVLAQAGKEWAEFHRDRISLALAFVLPLASLLMLGYGVRLESKNISLIIEDQDKSFASRTFAERLYATNTLVPGSWKGTSSPERAITAGGAKVAVIVPPDFSRDLSLGQSTNVQALVDGSDLNTAHVASAVIRGTNTFFSLMMESLSPAKQFHVVPRLRIWFNPSCRENLFIVPGVFAIVLWLYPSLLAAVAASREKDQGTVIQVYASGISPAQFIIGKGLIYIGIGLSEALVIMSVAALLFNVVPVTNPAALLLATPVYVTTAVMFGLCLGLRAPTQVVAVQAAATAGFFPALLLSGFVYPINNVPFPLSLFAWIVPARYYMEVTRDTFVRGAGWSVIWMDPLILMTFTLVLFIVTWLKIRRMQVP